MTIGEYIKEKMSLWSVELSDGYINIECSRVDLNPSETITRETKIDLFFYNVIPDIILIPSNISEGGYSIGRGDSVNVIKAYYNALCSKLGLPNLLNENTITDITAKW